MDDFLEFYNKTAKDGTWDKDDILLGVRGSRDRDLYRVMHSSIELKKDNKNYYIYMEVVTADKENPENKGIQIIDLATKKAYDDRFFLWHSQQGIYAQEKACEVLGDEIIKLEVCNKEVIETIYEKNSEEN